MSHTTSDQLVVLNHSTTLLNSSQLMTYVGVRLSARVRIMLPMRMLADGVPSHGVQWLHAAMTP